MQQSERTTFIGYIDEVIKATSAGTMVWKSVNPTTFVWETLGARIVFQRVERVVPGVMVMIGGRPTPRKQIFYLFQAFDETQVKLIPNPNAILNVDSTDDPDLTEKFNSLFELIKSGISEKSLDFLKSILPK